MLDAATLGVARSKPQLGDPGMRYGACAHWAWLQGDRQAASRKAFAADCGGGSAQGQDLGMRRRVTQFAHPIAVCSQNTALGISHDGSNWALATLSSGSGLFQGKRHLAVEHRCLDSCERAGGPAGMILSACMAKIPSKPSPDAESKPGERIAKVLARAGVASRREVERMIAAGRVRVNGKRLDSPALNVTDADRIEVDRKLVAQAEEARVWRYYKPVGLVTSERDEKGRATVFERLPPELPRVMSVGRLDLNSEGLLLLTNDGELKRRLELPSTGWLRRYRVRVHGRPDEVGLERLRKGITVDGERFRPMQVELDRQQGGNAWLTLGLREGRNREIRRAMEAIGLSVNRLIRVSYGPFQLGELAVGAVEEIRRRVLADQLGWKSSDSNPQGRKQ